MLLFSYDYSYLPFFTPIGSRVTNPKHIVDTLVANINDLRRKYHTDELQYLMSIGMDRKIYLRGINNRLDQPTITNKVFDLEPSLLELLFFLQNEEKYTSTAYIWAYSTGKDGSCIVNDIAKYIQTKKMPNIRSTIYAKINNLRINEIRNSDAFIEKNAIYLDDDVYEINTKKLKFDYSIIFHNSTDLEDHDNFVIISRCGNMSY